MSSKNPHSKTLFHLIPKNNLSHEALFHDDNRRFVSKAETETQDSGLEVGFHTSPPRGRVIARLGRGRAADLVLLHPSVSAVHVAFEIHPETKLVILKIKSKRQGTVSVLILPVGHKGHDLAKKAEEEEDSGPVIGDCVVVYGRTYRIEIADLYFFELVWRKHGNIDELKELAIEGYKESLQRLIRPCDMPTEDDPSELQSWHHTRISTASRILFREAPDARLEIGKGSFGTVYRTIDLESGHYMAVKVVRLDLHHNADYERAKLHREVKIHQRLHHRHIVECLGTANWDTDEPEIFLPLRQGTLWSLSRERTWPSHADSVCHTVLWQILSALDYLASQKLCHRDVKPQNLLYFTQDSNREQYTFQLADFGLSNHQDYSKTNCGTLLYQAPESVKATNFPQCPKMDIWSLFATLIEAHPKFTFPPSGWDGRDYEAVCRSIEIAADQTPNLAAMVRKDPAQRASAAQMLVQFYNGEGLTTPKSQVPPLDPPQQSQPNMMEVCRRDGTIAQGKRPVGVGNGGPSTPALHLAPAPLFAGLNPTQGLNVRPSPQRRSPKPSAAVAGQPRRFVAGVTKPNPPRPRWNFRENRFREGLYRNVQGNGGAP